MKRWDYKWQVVACVVFGAFMVIMDATIVNVALPTLQRQLGGDVSQIQWIISAYTLALGIITPLSGFLADRFGIKKVFLISLGLFTLGSVLCALAPNLPVMIAFRVLQGLGGGSVIPLGIAMLFGTWPPQQRGMALGIFGIALVFAPATGPVLGGAFVEYLDWRLIFLINVPIGLIGLWQGARLLRESKGASLPRFDLAGIACSTLAFGLLLYGFSSSAADGWGAGNVIFSLGAGAVFLVAFIFTQLARRDGLVDLRLFKNPVFIISNMVGWITVIGFFGAEFLMPLYLQVIRGLTPLQSGLMLLPLALTSGLLIPFTGKIYDRLGARPLVTVGFGLLVLNTWQLSLLEANTALWYVGLLLALRGVALACIVQSTQAVALSTVEAPALPRASSLVNSSRLVFQSLGIALLATILNSTAGAGKAPVEAGRGLPPEAQARIQDNFLRGLESAYLATFYVALAAIVLAVLLPGWPFQNQKARAASQGNQPAIAATGEAEKAA